MSEAPAGPAAMVVGATGCSRSAAVAAPAVTAAAAVALAEAALVAPAVPVALEG